MAIIALCSTAFPAVAQQYSLVGQQNIFSGQLSKAQYDSVKKLLGSYSYLPLKDTIVIKYQYAADNAAGSFSENDELIQQNIVSELRLLHNVQVHRKNVSLLNMLEPGIWGDSLKLYNNTAMTDADGSLHRLLFNQNPGFNSVILFPNKNFICIGSSDGWAALKMSAPELNKALSNNDLTRNNFH
ncbi:MAG: hypothetical protein EOO06_15540 [Chitinophagaceae bacterium]|nr:MAG: hypothetical protein EOO06_15540 [Chitinophagaceae bacterium]